MIEPITLEYELTPEDYAEWISFHSGRSPFHRRYRRNALLLVPAIWLAITLLGGVTAFELLTWVVFSAIWLGLVPPLLRWQTRRNTTKLAQQGFSRGSVGPHRLRIDERGIVDATPFSESRIVWAGIEEVVESPDQVLIYLGAHAAVIVPKRAFASDLAVGAFVEGMNELKEAAGASVPRSLPLGAALFCTLTAMPLLAQDGLPARGHLGLAEDLVTFEPCGAFEAYALATSGMVSHDLLEQFGVFGGASGKNVFVTMEGWMDTGPIEPAASAYAGTWVPTRVDEVQAASAGDCSAEPPPIWTHAECDRLSRPDVECLPADLVQADLRLARYVTEALRFARDPADLTAAHLKWKRLRDLRCAAERPGGHVDALWVLGCRVGQSRSRTQAIWDEYLKGTSSDLPDPRPRE